MTFEEWFKQYNEKHGLPPAHVVAKAAWNFQQERIKSLNAEFMAYMNAKKN